MRYLKKIIYSWNRDLITLVRRTELYSSYSLWIANCFSNLGKQITYVLKINIQT